MFAPGRLPVGPKVETKKALLLIDLQNDFVDANGTCYVSNTSEFLPKLPTLIKDFRAEGPVVWINTVYRCSVPIVSPQTGVSNVVLSEARSPKVVDASRSRRTSRSNRLPPTLESLGQDDPDAFLTVSDDAATNCCCLPDSTGVELPPTLVKSMDRKRDLLFWKAEYSAFGDFKLVMQLRARMVNDLYICGSLSNVGVFATVCDAVQQGFKVTVIEDCLGYSDELRHLQAMRRMADEFGVEGVDYQELMDDIHGLLGDIIPASTYTRTFNLAVTPQAIARSQISRSQTTSRWVESVAQAQGTEKPEKPHAPGSSVESLHYITEEIKTDWIEISSDESGEGERGVKSNTSPRIMSRHSPKTSPPRKRSTSDRDECDESTLTRVDLDDLPQASTTRTPTLKKSRIADAEDNRQRSATTKLARSEDTSPTQFLGQSKSTGKIDTITSLAKTISNDRAQSYPNLNMNPPAQNQTPRRPKKATKAFLTDDAMGDGDSRIDLDVLDGAAADEAFHRLKQDVRWQKMFHRTGEVPRLVAVQGEIKPSGGIPIYRHPADESPPLLPFDKTVDTLRRQCEELVGHPLNHVLIQHYRTSVDNISEHSDKTLDIARGSSIVNLSFGAMRTMTLRKKKTSSDVSETEGAQRALQRVRLPHNSLFVLGWRTNANWLHSIRADKRPEVEKIEEELAYNQERISLTFRNIATFLELDEGIIWGQGATQKERSSAKRLLQGAEADKANEDMIFGFGKENHLNEAEFDWDGIYGSGFDVVNYEVHRVLD